MVADGTEASARWHLFYPVSSLVYWSASWGEVIPRAILAFHCATGHVLLQSFRQCYCGDTK